MCEALIELPNGMSVCVFSVDPDVTTNGTDECLSDLINEEALVFLSQQPNLSKADSRVIRKASKVLL